MQKLRCVRLLVVGRGGGHHNSLVFFFVFFFLMSLNGLISVTNSQNIHFKVMGNRKCIFILFYFFKSFMVKRLKEKKLLSEFFFFPFKVK